MKLIKRSISMLLVVVLLLSVLPTAAFAATVVASGYCGGTGNGTNLSWTLTDDGTLTISGTGAMKDYDTNLSWKLPPWYSYRYDIKALVLSNKLTSIGAYAFEHCEKILSVSFPDSITTIKHRAFSYCVGLSSIYIPENITLIEDGAFCDCFGLEKVVVAETNPSYVGIDGVLFTKDVKSLLLYPPKLTQSFYSIPYGVTRICGYAFVRSKVANLHIPNTVTSIGKTCFYGCNNLTHITIPDSVTGIDSWAFAYCANLSGITLPVSVTRINTRTFDNCNQLTDVFYKGTEVQWRSIGIQSYNNPIKSAEIHFEKSANCFEAYTKNMPTLSSKSASVFLDFIYHQSGIEHHSEEDLQQSDLYKLMTGDFSAYNGDLAQLKADIIMGTSFIRATNAAKIGRMASASEKAGNAAVALAMTFAPSGGKVTVGDLGIINEYVDFAEKCFEKAFIRYMTDTLAVKAGINITSSHIDTIKSAIGAYSGLVGDISNAFNKAQDLLNGVLTAAAMSQYWASDDLTRAYTYFDTYVSFRPNCESTDEFWMIYGSALGLTKIDDAEALQIFFNLPDWKDCLPAIESWAEYVCAVEDYVYKTDLSEYSPDIHTWSSFGSNTSATCTENGEVSHICSVCGAKRTDTITAHGHYFSEYMSDDNTTCTSRGTITAYCNYGCGETKTKVNENAQLVCVDENQDLYCDFCNSKMECEHEYEITITAANNKTHLVREICMHCKREISTTETCSDNDKDHLCDQCDVEMPCGHINTEIMYSATDERFHTITAICHDCEEIVAQSVEECSDWNADMVCDICLQKLQCNHANIHIEYVVGADWTHIGTEVCNDCTSVIDYSVLGCVDSDENYICDQCKAVNIPTSVEKTSMVLGNDLSIMFAFTADGITDNGNYATITKSYADGTADRVERIEQSAWGDPIVIGGKNYYAISFDGVAAKEMTDEVQVQIFNADGMPISEVFTDSIRDYAMRMIENGTSVQMFVDMLVYGAEAQKQFENYGIDDMATSQLTEEQLAQATQTVSFENKLVADDGHRASSLFLENNIHLAMLFGGIDQTMTAEISFTDHYGETKRYTVAGSEFELVTYKGEACYSITVDELVMADARQLVTITVKNTDGNVVTSATDSVESYIARMSNTGTLYESIMKFSDSAAAGLKN